MFREKYKQIGRDTFDEIVGTFLPEKGFPRAVRYQKAAAL